MSGGCGPPSIHFRLRFRAEAAHLKPLHPQAMCQKQMRTAPDEIDMFALRFHDYNFQLSLFVCEHSTESS
uniref:Uncharacterized protein n=1 Tax=Bursaphelenchus xylophilus TaxID=6326 RepID=A0A1I7RS66_BURXY